MNYVTATKRAAELATGNKLSNVVARCVVAYVTACFCVEMKYIFCTER